MAYVWQTSIIEFDTKINISGQVLQGKTPKKLNQEKSSFNNFIGVFTSYFKKPLKNTPLKIQINERLYNTKTDASGNFKIEINSDSNSKFNYSIYFEKEELDQAQEYPTYFKNSKNKLGIISDIDDTILVSHTANIIKRIGVLSLVPPQKRKTIEFTQKLLSLVSLNKLNVFYVSKSESNLFELLSTFIQSNQLPKGALFLTPYLSFKELLKRKKGKDFKINNIQFILKNSPEKKFILFGDDTQKDMEVYRIIAKSYPHNIARIYIRQTKKKINSRKQLLWAKLKEVFPDSVYFNEHTNINVELELLQKLLQT